MVTICTASLTFNNSHVLPTPYLCVLCGSQNKQRLFLVSPLTGLSLSRNTGCSRRGKLQLFYRPRETLKAPGGGGFQNLTISKWKWQSCQPSHRPEDILGTHFCYIAKNLTGIEPTTFWLNVLPQSTAPRRAPFDGEVGNETACTS